MKGPGIIPSAPPITMKSKRTTYYTTTRSLLNDFFQLWVSRQALLHRPVIFPLYVGSRARLWTYLQPRFNRIAGDRSFFFPHLTFLIFCYIQRIMLSQIKKVTKMCQLAREGPMQLLRSNDADWLVWGQEHQLLPPQNYNADVLSVLEHSYNRIIAKPLSPLIGVREWLFPSSVAVSDAWSRGEVAQDRVQATRDGGKEFVKRI